MRDDIIAGLDIGSNAIRLVVGQKIYSHSGPQLQIIGAVEVPSSGINRGAVNSIEDTTSAISACIEKAERLIGVPIESVWASINGPHIKCERSKGEVAVSKSDGEITEDDVARAIEAARALSVPPNYEILHVIPVKFTVDNQEDIKDPIGMTGIRLEVETLIIQGLSSQIKNLTKAIYRTGLEIEDLVSSPLAAAEAVVGPKQKELGAALSTSVRPHQHRRFEGRNIAYRSRPSVRTYHFGCSHRPPLPDRFRKIKIEFGSAKPDQFGRKTRSISANWRKKGIGLELKIISQKYVSKSPEARAEILKSDNGEDGRSGCCGRVFLIGSGSTEQYRRCHRKIKIAGRDPGNKNLSSVIDKVNDPDS